MKQAAFVGALLVLVLRRRTSAILFQFLVRLDDDGGRKLFAGGLWRFEFIFLQV